MRGSCRPAQGFRAKRGAATRRAGPALIYDGPRAPSDPRRGSHPTKVGPRVLVKAAKPPLRSARFLATLYTQPQKALRNLVITRFGPLPSQIRKGSLRPEMLSALVFDELSVLILPLLIKGRFIGPDG